MSKITNGGFTWSGAWCFIAVPVWQQWASKETYECICFLMSPFSYILHIPYSHHVIAAEVRWLPPSLSQMVTDQRLRIVEHTMWKPSLYLCNSMQRTTRKIQSHLAHSSRGWPEIYEKCYLVFTHYNCCIQVQVCSDSVGKNVWNWTSDICYERWTGLRAKLAAFKHLDTIKKLKRQKQTNSQIPV